MTIDKILTVNEVAKILQVQPITVREMFREKRLRAFKVGKAWRTTETMLGEDIAAIARGAAPSALPMMGAVAPAPPPAASPEPEPAPEAAIPPPKKAAPRAKKAQTPPKPEPAAPKGDKEKKDKDDSQQLLF